MKSPGERGENNNGFSADALGNVYVLIPIQNGTYIHKSFGHLSAPILLTDPEIAQKLAKRSLMSEFLSSSGATVPLFASTDT